MKESRGKRVNYSNDFFSVNDFVYVEECRTYNAEGIRPKNPVITFPSNDRLSFSLRITIEQDIEWDARFHQRSRYPLAAIVYREDCC